LLGPKQADSGRAAERPLLPADESLDRIVGQAKRAEQP
jgi:hypothetical protein